MLNLSHHEKVKELIQQFAQAETNLQEFFSGQIDAVINPITGNTLLMHQAQEALLETEARYRHVLTGTSAIVFELSPEGDISFINDAIIKATGYFPEELKGRNWWELFFPEGQRTSGEDLLLKLQAGDITNYEVELVAKNGSKVTIVLKSANQYYEDKSLKKIFCLGLDITDQKKAIEVLQESEAKYRRIVETTFEGIVTVDDQIKLTFVNHRMAEMLGYTPEELLGRPILDFINAENQAEIRKRLKRRTEGLREQYELQIQKKDGSEIWVRFSSSPIINHRGEYIGGLALMGDITEHREREEQLRQSLKMDAIGRLAGGVAHDFNNILALILLSIDNPDVTFGMKTIQEAAIRAATLTRQLLAFSRKQVVQTQALELNNIVSDTERLLRRLIGENIEISTSLDPHLELIKGDRGQIEQVLMNLVINSRDAMPNGGKLTIATHNIVVGNQDSLVLQKKLPYGNYVLLSVTDTGMGIDKATMTRIFEPFFTTKELGKGTGLGLSILFGIVKQSGGETFVESKVGQGTTFKIYLPRFFGKKHVLEAVPVKVETLVGSETILYVEDDKALREIASTILRNKGYTVYEADNGLAAISVFEKYAGKIQLIITDVMMPEMSGPDFVAHLTTKLKLENDDTIKVLFLSGYSSIDLNKKVELDKGVSFLEKPYTAKQFLEKVRNCLGE